MDKFKFIEKDLLGGWRIEVRKDIKHIGNIRKNSTADTFQYFSGRNNSMNPSFGEESLDVLKKRIEDIA